MMTEPNDDDVKILELWRMSALLGICPKDVRDQMLLRLDSNMSLTQAKPSRFIVMSLCFLSSVVLVC